jgi:glycosyltransferase involved in cell wall biosynthesis
MADVTVVLPIRNGMKYLQASIESVLAQREINFKLHVLDDASNDGTPDLIASIRDPRLTYSRNPCHCGLFWTLNRGLREASTPLVRLWAQDDIMLPGSLAAFVEFSARHPSASMIYCDFFEIDAQGRRTGREAAHAGQRIRTPDVARPEVSALLFWFYGCLPGNISTVMIRRDVWAAVGGFLAGHQQAADYDMWVQISGCHDIGFMREKAIELRVHPLQLSAVGQKNMTTIEEELSIVRRLEARVASVTTCHERRRSWRRGRGREHVHWIARALWRGDLGGALRGWQAMRRYGQPLRQPLLWLASLNGRLARNDRDALFDLALGRLSASVNASKVGRACV